MVDERSIIAISRIERALARLERAGAFTPRAHDKDVSELFEAHQALRGRVQSAISQIDQLLESADRG